MATNESSITRHLRWFDALGEQFQAKPVKLKRDMEL